MTCLLAVLLACSETFVRPSDSGGPSAKPAEDTGSADADTDVDADTDADADGDTDTDADADTDTGPKDVDADHDGYTADEDCDDDDPRVHPDAPENWYDGTDQDCDGRDDDQDGDGYVLAEDCDDTDADVSPAGNETWYDGTDQDCDGNDDDQDGDGVPQRLDCDDTDASAYPEAEEVWYDGVDEACDGGDDYDRDGDGHLHASGGGDDCDDTDAEAYPGAWETLGDAVDGDCDGEEDGTAFTVLDTFGGTDVQGPRIAEMTGYVMVTFLAQTMTYGGSGLTAASGTHFLETTALDAGSAFDSAWEYGVGSSFDDGVDFWADDQYLVTAYGLRQSGARYLVADVYSVAAGDVALAYVSRSTSSTYDDVEMVEDDDGTLHVVGCEDDATYLGWIHGSPATLYRGGGTGDDISGADGDACLPYPSAGYIFVSRRERGDMGVWSYNDTTGLAAYGSSSPWNVYDAETYWDGTTLAFASAEGDDGVYAFLDPDDSYLPAADADEVDLALDSRGRMYVLVAEGGADAHLFWGDPAGGFEDVTLETGLARVDDVDVHVANGDTVVVAARGGDEIVYGAIRAY